MLNLKFIQDNPELVIEKLAIKRFDARAIVEKVIALYQRRNEVQNVAELQKSEMNRISKEIGQLMKEGKLSEVSQAKEQTVLLKEQIKSFEGEFDLIDNELAQLQVLLPNLPSLLVPAERVPKTTKLWLQGVKCRYCLKGPNHTGSWPHNIT